MTIAVYRARDTKLNRDVASKILPKLLPRIDEALLSPGRSLQRSKPPMSAASSIAISEKDSATVGQKDRLAPFKREAQV